MGVVIATKTYLHLSDSQTGQSFSLEMTRENCKGLYDVLLPHLGLNVSPSSPLSESVQDDDDEWQSRLPESAISKEAVQEIAQLGVQGEPQLEPCADQRVQIRYSESVPPPISVARVPDFTSDVKIAYRDLWGLSPVVVANALRMRMEGRPPSVIGKEANLPPLKVGAFMAALNRYVKLLGNRTADYQKGFIDTMIGMASSGDLQ